MKIPEVHTEDDEEEIPESQSESQNSVEDELFDTENGDDAHVLNAEAVNITHVRSA